jgi:hypothetical protein
LIAQRRSASRHYALFTSDLHLFYEQSAEIDPAGATGWQENGMTFRTRRPLLVKATQCTHTTTILTDCGQRKAYPGDWIIEGENRERYIVDNTFFQRTFAPIPWEPANEGRHYGS